MKDLNLNLKNERKKHENDIQQIKEKYENEIEAINQTHNNNQMSDLHNQLEKSS